MKSKLLLVFFTLTLTACSLLRQPIDVEDVNPEKLGVSVPVFEEIPFPFKHEFTDGGGYEFVGAALIDSNADGVEEVFIAGGQGQDGLYQFKDGKFVLLNGKDFKSDDVSYGVLSIDYNHDGKTDLIICRDQGVYLFLNKGKGRFSEEKMNFDMGPETTAISVTAGDINADGHFDFYFSTFITADKFKTAKFNDRSHAKPNKLFVSNFKNGKLSYVDKTQKSGTAVNQNTFLSAFVDSDNDGDLDIVAALNTGRPSVFKNQGKTKFIEQPNPAEYGFWMGLAICDYNSDGYQDVFMSNAGNSVPRLFVKGDLNDDQQLDLEWLLMEYKPGTGYINRAKEWGLHDLEFAWGGACADFNRDGQNDLVVMENYRGWFVHKWSKAPGRFLLQDNGKFVSVTSHSKVENYEYGLVPLASDFNGDGLYDLIYVNALSETRAFINKGPYDLKQYVTFAFPDSAKFVGAKMTVKTSSGRTLHHQVTNGKGYMSDLTNTWIVGLKEDESIKSAEVELIGKKRFKIKGIKKNSIHFVKN